MNIAIVGLGLIGGSISGKLKAKNLKVKVIGIARREETAKQALELGMVDEATTDLVSGIKDADIVFICTPIKLIIPMLKQIIPHLKPGAIITDVGSSKEWIVGQAEKLMPKDKYFIGSHPMAGKEQVKLEAAESALFKNKIWVITPTRKTNKPALKLLIEIIKSLGAKVKIMNTKKHDLAVAAISHMPLAVAASLVNAAAEEKGALKIAASGFRDTTRIASGDPELGIDMFVTNKKAVLKMLKIFESSLAALEKAIRAGNSKKINALLKRAKAIRDANIK